MPSRSASCVLPVASDRAFNDSSTVCEEPFNTSSISNSSIMSAAVMKFETLEQAQTEYGSKEKILTPGSGRQFFGGLEDSEPSQVCWKNGYPLEHNVPTFDASPVNNIVKKNTAIGPSYLRGNDITKRSIPDPQYLDTGGFKQLTSVDANLIRQASSSILHSAISRVNGMPSTQSGECSAISMQDSLISNLQAMALRSAPASLKVPPNLSWSSGSLDYELMKMTSRNEAEDTYAYPDGFGACYTSSTIGQSVGECPTFPYNGIGASHPEQATSHTRYSGYCTQDSKNIESPYTGNGTPHPEQKPHTRYSSSMQDLKNFEVHTNNCGYSTNEAVNDSQHLLRLHWLGNADFNFRGNHSFVNSSQNILTSNSYFSVEPIDVLNMASNYRSSLVGSDGNGWTAQHPPIEIDRSRNRINFQGSRENCAFGNRSAMDSRVTGRRFQAGFAANSENSVTSVLCRRSFQPFQQHDDREKF